MGRIADAVRQMRGQSLAAIVAEIERMEGGFQLALMPSTALDCGPSDFEEWWKAWPHRVAKKEAERAYRAARKRGHSPQNLLQWARAYIEQKPADRPWMNAATFLNGERWTDQPATVAMKPLRGLAAAKENLRQEIENDRHPREARPDPRYAGSLALWERH
jgi:hypothetical protein